MVSKLRPGKPINRKPPGARVKQIEQAELFQDREPHLHRQPRKCVLRADVISDGIFGSSQRDRPNS